MEQHDRHAPATAYIRFAAMISVSMLLMYGLMYLNSFSAEHVRFSQTRLWMTLIIGSGMTVVMLLFMWEMYANRLVNFAILAAAALVFAASLSLVRSQRTVADIDYMKAMIPHHSIAILTSERAQIRDPRVRRLADQIAETQRREIGEMDALIADIEAHGPRAPTQQY